MTEQKKWKPSRRELVAAIVYQALECARANNSESIDGTLMAQAFDDFLDEQDPDGLLFSYQTGFDKNGDETNDTTVVEMGVKGRIFLSSLIDHASNILEISPEYYSDTEE
jgi:hypothetical protein